MVKITERPRSWRGYLVNYSAMPWPIDVTEQQKEEWRREFEEKVNGVVSGVVRAQDEVDTIVRKLILDSGDEIRRILNQQTPEDLQRLKSMFYTEGATATFKVGKLEDGFQLNFSIR